MFCTFLFKNQNENTEKVIFRFVLFVWFLDITVTPVFQLWRNTLSENYMLVKAQSF